MEHITFKIYTLGCKVNQYDSNSLALKMIEADFRMVESGADAAIINTCSVTKTAIQKDKRMINKAKAENPLAKIVVMGCWPGIYGKNVCNSDIVWKTGNIEKLIEKIYNLAFRQAGFQTNSPHKEAQAKFKIQNYVNKRSRYFIKIQDGCEQYCTYCVIPFARGKLASRPVNEIVEEVTTAVGSGYNEIVLCGIHLGLFGIDLNQKPKIKNQKLTMKFKNKNAKLSLASLLNQLLNIKGLGRIRLSSIELNEVTDELIQIMAVNSKFCNHLHIPLQSGSDKILKLMNRPYRSKKYQDKIAKIRKKIPDISITTDVIVGFPGESEEDFNLTYDLIEKLKFSRLHVFPYSPHEKAPASKLAGQVGKQTIKVRAEELRILGNRLESSYRRKFKNKLLEVIVENERKGKFIGKTQYYFDLESDSRRIFPKCRNKKEIIGKLLFVKYS